VGGDAVAGSNALPAAVCLFGPTGTGKSDLAIRLASELNLEIVSVDSAMVYRRMDIGTAKPDKRVRERVAHHLVDIREPWESYSAGQFRNEALSVMADICARGRTPLLVGGTMLYFRALLRGLAELPSAHPGVRAAIEGEARERGWAALHAELARHDPVAAAKINPSDKQRIQRAIEVLRVTGKTISALQAAPSSQVAPPMLRIALIPSDREQLYRGLDRRFAEMLRRGLVEEVGRLRRLPLMSADCPAMRAVGYRQVWLYLEGDVSLAEAERRACVATRRLAKRQLTWIRSEAADITLDPSDAGVGDALLREIQSAGVSRCGQRCNIMGPPTESREHGV